MKDESLQEAFAAWENMSQSPESIYAYQSRLKYMLDEVVKAKKEGMEVGKEERNKEIIRSGLKIM